MLKLVIVEDEVNTLTELVTFIDWESIGFSVGGTFTSAVDALAYMKENPCDVLLTDIMMPIMNGIQLISEVRKLGLSLACVVLSAYNDFSFAQAAISHNVTNYLLKPFNPEEITTLFSALHDRIVNEKQQKDAQQRNERVLELSRTELVEKASENYLRGVFWTEETISFLLKQYQCVDVHDKYAIAIWSAPKEELLQIKRTLQEFCKERLDRTGILFQSQGMNVWWIVVPYNISVAIELDKLCKQLSIKILMSDSVSSLRECQGLFQKMLTAKDQLFSIAVGQCKRIAEIASEDHSMPGLDRFVSSFSEAIQNQNEIDLSVALNEFSTSLHNVQSTQELAAISLGDLCHNVVESLGQGKLTDTPSFHEIFVELYNLPSFSLQQDYVASFMRDLFTKYSSNMDHSSMVAKKIKEYIDSHYPDALSVSVLAKQFYFSANYISNMFQQQFGYSIPSYIKQVRLNKAKELLVESNAYVQDIATSVGIPNYRTFAKVFRDTYSMTPMEYRIIYRIKEPK